MLNNIKASNKHVTLQLPQERKKTKSIFDDNQQLIEHATLPNLNTTGHQSASYSQQQAYFERQSLYRTSQYFPNI